MNREDRANELAIENVEILRGRLETYKELLSDALYWLPLGTVIRSNVDAFLASQQGEQHSCKNCLGVDPESCMFKHPEQEEGAQGEREAFESAYQAENSGFMGPLKLERRDDGKYKSQHVESAWRLWQLARAALAQPSKTNTVAVDRGALKMVINALRRDAEEGRVVRGEMADALEGRAQPSPAPELVGRSVSVDVSTGDHDVAHRIFAEVVEVAADGTLLCEKAQDNGDVQALELEEPSVTGWLVPISGTYQFFRTEAEALAERAEYLSSFESEPIDLEPVPEAQMSVAQHERIVGALRESSEQNDKAANAWQRIAERAIADRDAALAKLAAMEKQEPAAVVKGDGSLGAGLPAGTKLYAHPVAQAGKVPEEWRSMDTAPKDGTLVRLLVNFEDMSIDDGEGPFATIGQNNRDNDEQDRWQFVGWCWEHDHFADGKGVPVGWLPMLAAAPQPAGSE